MKKLAQALIHASVVAERSSLMKAMRRMTVMTAVEAKRGTLDRALSGIASMHEKARAEEASWTSYENFSAGAGGRFDVCDLRYWLAIAEDAGVPFVPAHEILRLTQEEHSALSGALPTPDIASVRRAKAGLLDLANGAEPEETMPIDMRALGDRLYAAMDDVPESWMVRSTRVGGGELKVLAGFGVVDGKAPSVAFGPDLEVGPGWVRNGNRRRVNVSDMRTVEQCAKLDADSVFLARPWVDPGRMVEADDPHIGGRRSWPSEWRAFVHKGEVTGVASYYGWILDPTPENARIALEVRDLAQAIANAAGRRGAVPRLHDMEILRDREDWPDPLLAWAFDNFDGESVDCTLDFVETADGLLLLEAGPAPTPLGGGHPCAFAGFGRKTHKDPIVTEGVAFRAMPGVLIADPATWIETDPAGCVLTMDEVVTLADTIEFSPRL